MADSESVLESIRFAPGPMPACSRRRARRCAQDVIYHLETYDVTTIRAGTPMFAPPPRTKWTRRVPHPVRIGHAASLSQVRAGRAADRQWIEEHDFDPDPAPVLPLSTAPALTPLQACVSMMPRGSGEFLPAPLRPLVDAPDSPLAEMLGDDRNARLDIELLVQLVEQVDLAGVPQRDKVAAPSANLTHLLCKEC